MKQTEMTMFKQEAARSPTVPFINRVRTSFVILFSHKFSRLVSAVPGITKINENTANTKKQASKASPPRQKDNFTTAVGVQRVSPSSPGIELFFFLVVQFYLSSFSTHRQNHELLTNGELLWSCFLDFIRIRLEKGKFLAAPSYRLRACSYRQQFVAYPYSEDAAIQVLQQPYRLVET